MRKALVVLTVGLAAVATVAAPAAAQEQPVTGSFTATGSIEFGTGGCTFVRQLVDGTADLSTLGASSFHLDFCVVAPPSGGVDWPVPSGTFTLSAAAGTLTGNVGGFVQAGNQTPDGFPLHLVLTVTGGTEQLENATGEIVLDGFFGIGGETANGTVSGSLAGLGPPVTKDDCKNGGWQNLANDQGVLFPNQGQCVSFVVREGSAA
jgi:hypothetical protein